MRARLLLLTLTALLLHRGLQAQKLIYSQPEEKITAVSRYEIIGKVDNHFLVYKNVGRHHYITGYSNSMIELFRESQSEALPDRIQDVLFLPKSDGIWMIYQYRKKHWLYCSALKLSATGRPLAEEQVLDSVNVKGQDRPASYQVLVSENKTKLALVRTDFISETQYALTTLPFTAGLKNEGRKKTLVQVQKGARLHGFTLDNTGNLLFLTTYRNNQGKVRLGFLGLQEQASDSVRYTILPQRNFQLDSIALKVDNVHKTYLLASLFRAYVNRPVQGLWVQSWDQSLSQPLFSKAALLMGDTESPVPATPDDIIDASREHSKISDIILVKDSGFIIHTEPLYRRLTADGNFAVPFARNSTIANTPVFPGREGQAMQDLNERLARVDRIAAQAPSRAANPVRFFASSIRQYGFNSRGELSWQNTMHKRQQEESDYFVSYLLGNAGQQLHYFFNQTVEKKLLLYTYAISASGELKPEPELVKTETEFRLMPRFGKQVTTSQIIIPCISNNRICFARLEF